MINQFIPTLMADPYGQLDSSMPQTPQAQQFNAPINPMQMAEMLRNQGQKLNLPDSGMPQMNNVAGMGNFTGTGLTYGNIPIGFGGFPTGQ